MPQHSIIFSYTCTHVSTGFRISDQGDINHIWRTCCALHNLLLEKDNLSTHWQTGVANPDFGGFSGDQGDQVPQVFERLARANKAVASNDLSGMARDLDGGERDRIVRPDVDKSYSSFKSALIEHFSYRWDQGRASQDRVVWPRRNGRSVRGRGRGVVENHDD